MAASGHTQEIYAGSLRNSASHLSCRNLLMVCSDGSKTRRISLSKIIDLIIISIPKSGKDRYLTWCSCYVRSTSLRDDTFFTSSSGSYRNLSRPGRTAQTADKPHFDFDPRYRFVPLISPTSSTRSAHGYMLGIPSCTNLKTFPPRAFLFTLTLLHEKAKS